MVGMSQFLLFSAQVLYEWGGLHDRLSSFSKEIKALQRLSLGLGGCNIEMHPCPVKPKMKQSLIFLDQGAITRSARGSGILCG